ncbi:Uncharacterized protein YebE, UPF0316 family [Cyclonatronum proteinivorum]|uniref:UPF0316 protein CYPRO_0460 n=1 Tax=Cyclonatronum proteinivorum TaxID=1457365 RepID=A0A345UGZ4_9BACT|nr:DUF2179 domain-containing protein [Cyclonatronum proteinivorum]AXI99745.1 Uncharacterized protein YebE, UPF0316 family [Cyclonatronum proteinivorum]
MDFIFAQLPETVETATASGFDWFAWIVLPLLIFLARIVDQSLGTLRIIFVSRSMRKLAAMVGFFESLIWLVAISQIIQNLDNWVSFIAFAGGFSMGNYVGIYIESKLAMGMLCMRIITAQDATELTDVLRENKYGATTVSATGRSGQVRLILTIIKRRDLEKVQQIVQKYNPNAFVSVEDIRSVHEGVFPEPAPSFLSRLNPIRK